MPEPCTSICGWSRTAASHQSCSRVRGARAKGEWRPSIKPRAGIGRYLPQVDPPRTARPFRSETPFSAAGGCRSSVRSRRSFSWRPESAFDPLRTLDDPCFAIRIWVVTTLSVVAASHLDWRRRSLPAAIVGFSSLVGGAAHRAPPPTPFAVTARSRQRGPARHSSPEKPWASSGGGREPCRSRRSDTPAKCKKLLLSPAESDPQLRRLLRSCSSEA